MNTAEMWVQAKIDGKTYSNDNMLYNRKFGFVWRDSGLSAEALNENFTRTDILSSYGWKISNTIMTKSEAEKKFNIKIIG